MQDDTYNFFIKNHLAGRGEIFEKGMFQLKNQTFLGQSKSKHCRAEMEPQNKFRFKIFCMPKKDKIEFLINEETLTSSKDL